MKIILRKPSPGESVGRDISAADVIVPEDTTPRRLAEQFCRLGRQRRGTWRIRLDADIIAPGDRPGMVRLIVRSLWQGAYRFRKEGLSEIRGKDIFALRDCLADVGDAVYYLECGEAEDEEIRRAARRGKLEGRCISHARSLGNLPANYLGAEAFARYIGDLARYLGVPIKVLGSRELEELGCGGILAVNQGSGREAKLAVLTWEGAPGKPFTALVGKGILFDSGGYHLKSMQAMEGMKYDMCGAANVLEAFEILVREGAKENLTVVLPLAENAIGPEACRMGDVVHMLGGTTVEIYNTDAEGRLILADALTYAQQCGAARILDLATLTYSCQAALGDRMTGLFANDSAALHLFEEAAGQAGELVWNLPLDSHYREMLAWSTVADLANYAPGKGAGASVAAAFLESFIREGVKWIHLDAVGPSVMRGREERMAEGATGANIASVVTFLEKGSWEDEL